MTCFVTILHDVCVELCSFGGIFLFLFFCFLGIICAVEVNINCDFR